MTRLAHIFLILSIFAMPAFAGGPILVGGPGIGTEGLPFTWNVASFPIKYRVDGGPMASRQGTIIIDHAAGLARVNAMFSVWSSVSTASLQYQNAGDLLPAGSFTGGDVDTLAELDDVLTSCDSGVQSPVVFDATGALFAAIPDGQSFI